MGAVFKEYQIRKMIDNMHSGAISMSRFVDLLNRECYLSFSKIGEKFDDESIMLSLEAYLAQNENVCKNEVKIKIQELIGKLQYQKLNQ